MSDPPDSNSPPLETIVIENRLVEAKKPTEHILDLVKRRGYSDDARFAIRLALEEAMTNAIKHGNCGDPNKKVTVRFYVGPDQTIICVADEGPGFEPCDVPDCTASEHISKPNGRGIMLMKAYLDEISYSEQGNEVRLVKRNN